jgi:hypothetical protein
MDLDFMVAFAYLQEDLEGRLLDPDHLYEYQQGQRLELAQLSK